jgi:tRNA(Ile)-lysidine synthase
MEFEKRVWDFSTSQDLLDVGNRVVLGVSGGPDSLCLLDVLHSLGAKHRLELYVAHLNHGLRPEAAAEAEFVRGQAEQRSCGYYSETVDTRAVAAAHKQSLETAARELRYDFLRRVARRVDASRVAVAHTADDQAETVLMHLLRGSGLRGLRGMRPKRAIGKLAPSNCDASPAAAQSPVTNYQLPVFLIRPLLQITRSEVLSYCAEHNLTPSVDASNSNVRYVRNRVRHELLPLLEAYNPNIRAGLARTAEVLAGDYEIWHEAVQRLWQDSVRIAAEGDGRVSFDREPWLALSQAQQRALLRAAARRMLGDLEDIDFVPLDAAVQFSRHAAPGRSCLVVAGLALKVEPEQISLVCNVTDAQADSLPRVVDGELAPDWRLESASLGPGAWSSEDLAAAPGWTAYLDAERLAGPITMRARRPGDRFQPAGMRGHTAKLSDYLVNRKIPARHRDQWPLLVCGGDIVWVVGLRLDERYKVTTATRNVLRLSLSRLAEH